MHNADIIAGFSGSALHNSIFSQTSSTVIELCDERLQNNTHPNQEICAKIAENRLETIPYTPKDSENVYENLVAILGK